MLVLYETAAGYALFKVKDGQKLDTVNFEDAKAATDAVSLRAFCKFLNTTDALSQTTALVEGKLTKPLRDFLEDHQGDTLVVADPRLGAAITKKLNFSVVADSTTNELFRNIRAQLDVLITGLKQTDMNAMVLGLSHSLSRYKLKFSPDKVDTMIIQAIALLDDLDKELNTYAMRAKEWYGWHFPEMARLIVDNLAFAKTVKKMGVILKL
jgi:nucleolar protein 58